MPETKGITIEFYGKSIELENTLDDVNKGLRATRAELNDFKKQLKIDPSNVEALQGKFKALRQEEALINKQIEMLRSDLSKLDKEDIGGDKWIALTKEVNKAETKLQAVQREISNMDGGKLDELANSSKKLSDGFVEASQGAVSLGTIIAANLISDAIKSGLQFLVNQLRQIPGELHEWADAYREVQVYEKQFESNLKNTADASDEQIASLKKLAKQKERTGVVSSKAITSAYQELATYVESADAISGLTDALTDMAAQQYGVDATDESVRNLATTLGKALANGDYSGLTRLGYGFDEAQQKIMKYGTELERVAVLNDVIESSIGGINEALAQTDEGKLFAASQYIDDVKESVGEMISQLEIQFVEGIMPTLQELLDNVLVWIDEHKDEFVQFVADIIGWLTSDQAKQWFEDIGHMVEDLWEALKALKDIIIDIGLVEGALWALGKAVEFVKDLIIAIRDALRSIKDEGLFNWMRGNYESYDFSAGGDSWTPGWSGGYGALNSGGYASGGISLNANFNVTANNVTRADVQNWASWLADDINEELGRRIR